MSQAKAIWDNLTQHEVTDRDIQAINHTRNVKDENGNWHEEQYQLHYYSWSACWRELMNRFPDAQYEFSMFEREGKLYDVMYYADSTASVHCKVTINSITRDMWLPVMDYKNKAVPNPDARAISDTKMRCLVKTIAMFGLGLDIYEGKYVPPEQRSHEPELEQPEADQVQAIEFQIYDDSGEVQSVFTDARSWIKAMNELPPRQRSNDHNRGIGQIVVNYIQHHDALTDRVKTNTINQVNSLFDME